MATKVGLSAVAKVVGLGLALSVFGCASSEETEEGGVVEVNKDKDAAVVEEMDEGEGTATIADDPMPTESVDPFASEMASSPAPVETPAEFNAAPAGMTGDRVVRYVKTSGSAVHSGPSDSAPTVKTLEQGDHLLVTVEGTWARVGDGQFVATKHLSAKAVPRMKKTNEWRTHSH